MDCQKCKYFIQNIDMCILGRRAEYCSGLPARRGDDELIDRVAKIIEDLDQSLLKKFSSETNEED